MIATFVSTMAMKVEIEILENGDIKVKSRVKGKITRKQLQSLALILGKLSELRRLNDVKDLLKSD